MQLDMKVWIAKLPACIKCRENVFFPNDAEPIFSCKNFCFQSPMLMEANIYINLNNEHVVHRMTKSDANICSL